MIQSKTDYKKYITADYRVNHANKLAFYPFVLRISGQYNLLYLSYLRRLEYYQNCKKGFCYNIFKKFLSIRLRKLSALTGISIPPNTFGYGLYIPHWGSIVVNNSARFGNECVIQSGVNISENVIGGNHIYLGAGAKILKNIQIANDVIIGANAVVTKDFQTPNVVVAGVPASIISNKGFRDRQKI